MLVVGDNDWDIVLAGLNSSKIQREIPISLFRCFLVFRVLNFLLVGLGVGIILGAVQLNKFFNTYATGVNSYLLMVFIYLGGVGLMIALFGAGLLLQDFYHVTLIVLSKLIWRLKKNMVTFSLINIRSDVKLFSSIMATEPIIE